MPYSVEWLLEPNIVFEKLWGEVTYEDLEGVVRDSVAFADASPVPRVQSLLDMTDVKSLPPNVARLSQIMAGNRNSKLDHYAIFGGSKLIRFMADLVGRATPFHYRAFDTRAEAEEYLRNVVRRDEDLGH